MRRCRTCRWWSSNPRNAMVCNHEGLGNQDVRCEISVRVVDDYGLDYNLVTGPSFGCVNHEHQVVRNPLGFWCPPNGAGPDMIAYTDFKMWVAYALMICWFSRSNDDPNEDCNYVRPLTRDDVKELRAIFVDRLENLLLGFWGDVYEPDEGLLDLGSFSHNIALDDDDDEEDPVIFGWDVTLQDDSIMFELIDGEDGTAIWLYYEAIVDRAAVMAVMSDVYDSLGLPGPSEALVRLSKQQAKQKEEEQDDEA